MPPDLTTLGRWILAIGLAVAGIGALLWLAGRVGLPIGRIPGDLHLASGSWSCFIPLGTSILLSLVLTVLLNLFVRWLGR